MQARLKTSQQWTPFPEELCQLCVDVLSERFCEEYGLENSQFVVEGRIFNNEILGRFGLKIQGQLKQPNFEISMDFDGEKDKALPMIQKSMDLVDHLWTEFLEEDMEDKDLSPLWQSLEFNSLTYHYRYSTINSELEQEADKLLQEYEKKLVYGEAELEEDPTEPDFSQSTSPSTTLH
jgi:hypothetical protein